MPARLYVVHGSHPCDAVAKALELKGIAYKRVELPAGSQPIVMKARFGGRTVPGIRFDDGTKVQGSTHILRELERRQPEPKLYGSPQIEEAERWGDEVLQPLVRRVLWMAFTHHPDAMYDFQQGQKAPKLPRPVIKAAAPLLTRWERSLNDADDAAARADLQELPTHLDRIDAWIADGTLNGDEPNAADLQIATSVRLLHTVEDARKHIAGRPAEEHAFRWFAPLPGSVPAGVLAA